MIRSRLLTAAAASLALTLGAFGGTAHAADPHVAPGGNFDLSVWQLQEPVGSPGSPTRSPRPGCAARTATRTRTSTPTPATAR